MQRFEGTCDLLLRDQIVKEAGTSLLHGDVSQNIEFFTTTAVKTLISLCIPVLTQNLCCN
jgi:hypothetical protein